MVKNKFLVGCNYWASHAGTAMWKDWNADTVDKDFEALAKEGLRVLRVFPLWPDFQPIHALYKVGGILREYRFGDMPLPDDEYGRAGISREMMGRFEVLTALADKYGLKLIPGLITGWMSGRLFVPPGLEGRRILSDPECIKWQIRFVRCFVERFKSCESIIAWDLGNECNQMENVPSREAAWTWTAAVTNSIRSADSTRPVISGMHGLTAEGTWTISDQGEITDMLTTHPYPVYTPHCDMEPLNTLRSILHSTSESLFYQGVGGKPCLVEEIGSLGPTIADDRTAAQFARAAIFSSWAHGLPGFLWWCANDHKYLTHPPYDWNACESELGLLRGGYAPKPVIKEIGKFLSFLQKSGLEELPPRIAEGVCVITRGQDQWAAALASFVLAKQSGFDIVFQDSTQPIPEADIYLLPSVMDITAIDKHRYLAILEKVKNGAALYISLGDGILNPFEEVIGMRIKYRRRRIGKGEMHFDGAVLPADGGYQHVFENINAEVLGRDEDGNALFSRVRYGSGLVYFLGFPLEIMLAGQNGAFGSQTYHKIYSALDRGKVRAAAADEVVRHEECRRILVRTAESGL
jgi:hypothetical protein